MRVIFLVIIIAALVGGFLWVGGDDARRKVTDGERLVGVTVANKVLVAAKRGGRLIAVWVREGDLVEQGAEIALLDASELEAQRDGALAKVALAEARLAELEEQLLFERDKAAGWLARARANLAVARSRVAQAEAELDQKRADEVRARELKVKNLAATQEAERLATDVLVWGARLKAEQELIKVAEAEVLLAQAAQHRDRIVEEQVAQARAELDMVGAELSEVQARLADTRLIAPVSGVVAVRIARQGEVVQAGGGIVTLVDLDDVWVEAEVEESRIRRIRLGEEFEVLLPDGSQLTGEVSLIAPEASFATRRDVDRVKRDVRTFGFRVRLGNANRRLHAGMTAYVLLPEAAPAGPRAP